MLARTSGTDEADAATPDPTLTLEGADAAGSSGLPVLPITTLLLSIQNPTYEDPDGYRTLDNEYQVTVAATDSEGNSELHAERRW